MLDQLHFHLMGIGGSGMAPLARLLKARGARVSGCDYKESPTVEQLREEGVIVHIGHDPSHLHGADRLVVSTAVQAVEPELREAHRLGIEVVRRAEALAELTKGYKSVAIAGSHGKTTTTGMIAVSLHAAGADPSYMIGSDLRNPGSSSRLGTGDIFAVEADESDASFLFLHPYLAVVTNIDNDHLDHYRTMNKLLATFRRFLTNVQPGGKAIMNADDTHCRRVGDGLNVPIVYFGFDSSADLHCLSWEAKAAGSIMRVAWQGKELGEVILSVPGRHNASNAMAALAVGLSLGYPFEKLSKGLSLFTGTRRRLEPLGEIRGSYVYDDYGHHPTEVRATLAAARQLLSPGGRLMLIFQPHRYSRTRMLASEFGPSFLAADRIYVTEIYAAGEKPIPGVSGSKLAECVADSCGAERVFYRASRGELLAELQDEVRPGDLVLFMGAGDIRLWGEAFVQSS